MNKPLEPGSEHGNRIESPPSTRSRRRWPWFVGTLLVAYCAWQVIEFSMTPGRSFALSYWKLVRKCTPLPPLHDPWRDRCALLNVEIDDWQSTPEGRAAHAIAIPNPVTEDSGYRWTMTPLEYFQNLCEKEAGEFIFKTVDKVEGIRLLRPREIVPSGHYKFHHLHAMEDPYGYWEGEVVRPFHQLVGPTKYTYIEMPIRGVTIPEWDRRNYHVSLFAKPTAGQVLERYSGYDPRAPKGQQNVRMEHDANYVSRYGITWRGIRRPKDREMGIAGGELIVLDMHTKEVLGVRRGYALYRGSWETLQVCPRYAYDGGMDKSTYFTYWFVGKVARPPRWREFFDELEKLKPSSRNGVYRNENPNYPSKQFIETKPEHEQSGRK